MAVIARNTWTAQQGAARLRIESAPGTGAAQTDSTRLFDDYRDALKRPDAPVFREDGDVNAALSGAGMIAAEYRLPYLAHLCMEPMNCTALLSDGRLTVWAPTQANSIARDVAAETAGLPPEQVTVHTTLMGGGFGRRAEMDFVSQAVTVAMALPGTPVQVSWSREQDVRHDMYRPAALVQLRAALDENGALTALDYKLVTQSVVASYFERTPTPRGGDAEGDGSMASGASNLIYAVPNLRVSAIPVEPGVPVGYWRSTGTSYNAFVVEAFMDELAAAAGTDPLGFRLRHLPAGSRHRRVLETAASRAGWEAAPPAGWGRGLALTESHGSICAQVVEVSRADEAFKVERVTCVLDCACVIHPDIARSQVESAILDGLAAALHGEITLRDGQAEQGNFDTYPLLRLADTPVLDIEILTSGGRPGGLGEPACPAWHRPWSMRCTPRVCRASGYYRSAGSWPEANGYSRYAARGPSVEARTLRPSP
jgi:isoquinoline 1-oxidoreductase beta subunit